MLVIPALGKLRQEDYHEFESYQDYSVRPISENPKPWICKANILQSLKRSIPDTDQIPSLYTMLITTQKVPGSSQPCTVWLIRGESRMEVQRVFHISKAEGRDSFQIDSCPLVTVQLSCLCWEQASCGRQPWPPSLHIAPAQVKPFSFVALFCLRNFHEASGI